MDIPLVLSPLGHFLALRPVSQSPAIESLAADCVRAFDRFRAAPSAQELARRRTAGLSPAEEHNLQTWGYPYVMEAFRLHFTLTGRLNDSDETAAIMRHLAEATDRLLALPFRLDALCVFRQAGPDQPFRVAARLPFGT